MFKVACTGAHGTGKTTLMDMVEQKLTNVYRISNITRDLKSNYNVQINNSKLKSTQLLTFAMQYLSQFDKRIEQSDYVVSDRGMIDVIAYSHAQRLPYDLINVIDDAVMEILPGYWDLLVYTPIKSEVHIDGLRDTDVQFREMVDMHCRDLLSRMCYQRELISQADECVLYRIDNEDSPCRYLLELNCPANFEKETEIIYDWIQALEAILQDQ